MIETKNIKASKEKNVDAIYIHIPFCSKKCEYCDFCTFTNMSHEYEKYVKLSKAKPRTVLATLGNDAGIYGGAKLVFNMASVQS